MRFFCGLTAHEYPDTAPELRATILAAALEGPFGPPVTYFRNYFASDGGIEHPLLGNLMDLLLEIELAWAPKVGDFGMNYVAGFLTSKLNILNPTSSPNSPIR